MKIRSGFVSNSSSSSFVIININEISPWQLAQVIDAKEFVKDQGILSWDIILSDNKKAIKCYTYMDNFNLMNYFVDIVGINEDNIKTDDFYLWFDDSIGGDENED